MTDAADIPSGLTYYPDSRPGIRRLRRGRGFSYRAPDDTTIADADERKRIEALAIPPAYENVWICPKVNGHLQATGLDARARKQYRYHPDWSEYRASRKYDDLATFGEGLPRLRRRIRAGLKGDPGTMEFAVAALLRLLDRAALRIGTANYAETNGTYGATTLTRRHLRLSDDEIRLSYVGKGNRRIRRQVKDRGLHRALERLGDLPGARLFTWIDDNGTVRDVTSDAVNATLTDIFDTEGITAKTFRTWAGSEAAIVTALSDDSPSIKSLAEAASARLFNTPTIARTSYIHPSVIALTEDEPARRQLAGDVPDLPEMRWGERALMKLLTG